MCVTLTCRIFITHLHGDHCFGLATALQLIDDAKSSAWAKKSSGRLHPIMETQVYGPPGLKELLRVSLALTGEVSRLRHRVSVTELVLDSEDLKTVHEKQAMEVQVPYIANGPESNPSGMSVHSSSQKNRSESSMSNGPAAWNQQALYSQEKASASNMSSLMSCQQLGSLSLSNDPGLKVGA
jgi:ribonuclease BN (tRNA processing enzyme)